MHRDLTKKFNEQLKKTHDTFKQLGMYYLSMMTEFGFGGDFAYSDLAIISAMLSKFVSLVETNGQFDLKDNPNTMFNKDKLGKVCAYYNGQHFESQDF